MEHIQMPDTIVLETDRLLLKELTPELYDYMFDNWTEQSYMITCLTTGQNPKS